MGKKTIIPAAQIKEMLEAKKSGTEYVSPAVLASAIDKAANIESKLTKAEEENLLLKAKLKSQSPQGLRLRLEEALKEFGITAAFEPLIELATERYPMDFLVDNLRGQLVCSVDQRIKIWSDILQYQMPKLKAVEVAGQVDSSITVVIRKFGDDSVIERAIPVTEVPVKITQLPSQTPDNPDVIIRHFD